MKHASGEKWSTFSGASKRFVRRLKKSQSKRCRAKEPHLEQRSGNEGFTDSGRNARAGQRQIGHWCFDPSQ